MLLFEIIFSILLFISSIILIFIVIMQDSKQPNNSSAITGASGDSYYSKNQTRTRDLILSKITKIVAITFFALLIIINAVNIFAK